MPHMKSIYYQLSRNRYRHHRCFQFDRLLRYNYLLILLLVELLQFIVINVTIISIIILFIINSIVINITIIAIVLFILISAVIVINLIIICAVTINITLHNLLHLSLSRLSSTTYYLL